MATEEPSRWMDGVFPPLFLTIVETWTYFPYMRYPVPYNTALCRR